MKLINECKGARVHSALLKTKTGENKITWKVHYKNESVWCNSMEEVVEVLHKITMVQLFGDQYKTWKVGEKGWHRNMEEADKNDTERV